MKLGLHTYSLNLHGIGQAWAGFKWPWPRQISTFELMDMILDLDLGIRIAVENHCDSFSEEILWLLDQVDHPSVGACIDADEYPGLSL